MIDTLAIIKHWADQGLLVEGGWQSFKAVVLPADASKTQVSETRKAFFAGAQHLFSSMIGMMDSDTEPTAKDLQRMDAINVELKKFIEDFKRGLGHGN